MAAYVDDEVSKFADGKWSNLFLICLLDVDAVYESKKKVRKPPARKDNSKMVNGVVEWKFSIDEVNSTILTTFISLNL